MSPATAPSATQRDSRLDVAKGVLIFLVVFGHLLPDSAGKDVHKVYGGWFHEPQHLLIVAIYLFHMPLFVAITGVTARANNLAERIMRDAVLLVGVQCLFLAMQLAGSHRFTTNPAAPIWVLWYLMGMVVWRALLPAVQRRPQAMLVGSVVAALLVGVLPFNGDVLAYSRVVVFFPFFVVGHLYGAQILRVVGQADLVARLGAVLVFVGVTVVAWQVLDNKDWLHADKSFDHMGVGDLRGIGSRALMLLASGAACLAAMFLVPAVKGLWSSLGERSLPVFLLHGVPVLVILPGLMSFSADKNHWLMTAFCVVLTVPIVWFCSFRVWDRLLRDVSGAIARFLLGRRGSGRHASAEPASA